MENYFPFINKWPQRIQPGHWVIVDPEPPKRLMFDVLAPPLWIATVSSFSFPFLIQNLKKKRGGEGRWKEEQKQKKKKKRPTENKHTQILFFSCSGPTSSGCIKYFWAATEKDPVVSCHTCDYFISQGQRELWGTWGEGPEGGGKLDTFLKRLSRPLSLPFVGSIAVMSALHPTRAPQPLMNWCGSASSRDML